MIIGIIGIVIISSIIGYIVIINQDNSNGNTTHIPSYNQNQTEIRISISNISATATFYSYNSNDKSIRYFVVKDSQGDVHVAFDACDVCYEAKKGYRQNDELMTCINCRQEFPIVNIGIENTAGGCWPSYLPMVIDNDNVVIKITDLLAKSYMF
jgi:uncharacterized membrane protein